MTRERLYRANIVEGWHIGCVREHKKVNALYVAMFTPHYLLCVILSEVEVLVREARQSATSRSKTKERSDAGIS